MVKERRPELAKTAIDWTVGHLASGRRVTPTAFMALANGQTVMLMFPDATSREEVRRRLMAHAKKSMCVELAIVCEASSLGLVDGRSEYSMELAPKREAGCVLVTWESKEGDGRVWLSHISFPAPSVLLTDGFREVELYELAFGFRSDLLGILGSVRELVLSN